MMDAATLKGVALVCTALALAVSSWTLAGHLRAFSSPAHQTLLCRILLLVPIYASSSALSLLAPGWATVLATLRDCYEAFVINAFFQLLMAYLGGARALGEWLETQGHVRHSCVVRAACPRHGNVRLDRLFLRRVRQGVLQFVFVKPFTAVLSLLLSLRGVYDEGSYSLHTGYFYVSVVNNASVSLSLYCLVLFYKATASILRPFRPIPKFTVVKAVVFFSYWQYCALQSLFWAGVIPSQESVRSLQDIFICIEMLVAAIAHHFAFPPSDYVLDDEGRSPMSRVLHKAALHASTSRPSAVSPSRTRAPSSATSTSKKTPEVATNDDAQGRGTDVDVDVDVDVNVDIDLVDGNMDDADDSTELLPRLIKVLDGRDVLQQGRQVFLDRQQSDTELHNHSDDV